MRYLLDTNVCIEFLRGRKPLLVARFTSVPQADKHLCPVVQAELYFGAFKSAQPQASLATVKAFISRFPVLPFDEASAETYGVIRADLAGQGRLIGPYDLQIAAIALAHGATLVTHNTGEFSRVAGLQLDDWEI
ncbi:MAG TPA: type II toxin-antitoxin system VapC family toxin [Blastocatellia bacterium]|nr:type II toxin-antitoxin system VapC family toxin [Blastocatellia bacterium]